ncbi:Aminotransferase class I and II [Vreelandella aquamarina]|uniref:cysteine-S-conjugate beta-lyase n=1 Tax=Vreelandella aquamarina TaxID=77097 RepID=A0A1H8EAV9_9GAMM|nr:Aminotransferase class I and II [Halomonas aquamarina]
MAGLTSACAVIPDATLRKHFAAATKGFLPDGNVLGLVAAEAAYREGEPWRQALLDVLRSHRAALEARVATWSGVSLSAPESTYLAWLDMRETGLGASPAQALLEQAGVALSDGAAFGCPGFVRLNFGTTASQLEAALSRMDTLLKA